MKWMRGGAVHRERSPSLRARSVLLVAAGALVLAYLGGWRVMGGRAAREIERLRRQGEPLRPSALLPKFAPGEENAADLYEEAFDIEPSTALGPLANRSPAQWTAAEKAAAQALVASNERYFDLLARAARVEKCSFPIDWDAPAHVVPQAAQLRHAAWALRVQAGVRAHRGDGDGALAAETRLVRMASQSGQMPSIAGYMVGAQIDGFTFDDLPFVLDSGGPSPAACRALSGELAKQDPAAALIRVLRADRAWGLRIFEAMESGTDLSAMLVVWEPQPAHMGLRSLRAYPRVGMPVWYHDKAAYLEAMRDVISAAGHPWPQGDAEMTAAVGRLQVLGGATSEVARILASGLDTTALARDRTAAKLGLARIALALKAYQAEHGHYPASLTPVEKAGWPLPRDSFTGKPFHYRRERTGFTIWSTGPDMVDDKGAQHPPSGPQRAPGGGYVAGCDCVMRCNK